MITTAPLKSNSELLPFSWVDREQFWRGALIQNLLILKDVQNQITSKRGPNQKIFATAGLFLMTPGILKQVSATSFLHILGWFY